MYALIITARLARGIALALLILAMCLTIATASAGVAWRRRYWSVIGRTHYTLLTLGALGFIGFLNQWNLLGFRWRSWSVEETSCGWL